MRLSLFLVIITRLALGDINHSLFSASCSTVSEDGESISSSEIRNFHAWKNTAHKVYKASKKMLENLEADHKQKAPIFSGFLHVYRMSNNTMVQQRIAEEIRTYAPIFSSWIDNGAITQEDIWLLDMPCVEEIQVNAENLDALLATGRISSPPADIEKGIRERREAHFVNLEPNFIPKFFRLPSSYTGQVFIIGGERHSVDDQQDVYTLNFNPSFFPDILGKAEDLTSLIAIPDSKFARISFNFIDPTNLFQDDILTEYYRMLQSNGSFEFKSMRSAEGCCQIMMRNISMGSNIVQIFQKAPTLQILEDLSWTDSRRFYVLLTITK